VNARGWQGTDGSDTAMLLHSDRLWMWTNLGMWIEVQTDDVPVEVAAEQLAETYGLEPMHPDRLNGLLSVEMTEDEAAGYGDSQER
jgi:hypothetical protein